jgi:ComF family protein
MSLAGEVLAGLVELAFPALCCCCGRPLGPGTADFCPACCAALTADAGPHCPRCADRLGPFEAADTTGCARCRHLRWHFDASVRLGPYQHFWKYVVLRCKHLGGELLAEALGGLLASQHAQRWSELAGAAGAAVVVVPVPLHWTRRLLRGYNQAAALATGLARRRGWPCEPWALRRTRSTGWQSERTFEQRSANVRGAFALAVAPARIQGRVVILVDDVYTSGSTLSECARLLRRAGAVRVVAAVVAHGQNPDTQPTMPMLTEPSQSIS